MRKKVLAFSGYSGSGKTTLIEKIIKRIKEDGYSVAVIKHDAHDFDMDREGKDTYRFTAAGADTVMISSAKRSARISEHPESIDEMLTEAGDADIVLVEGYKDSDLPKMFILSKETGYCLISDKDKNGGKQKPCIRGCIALVTDDEEACMRENADMQGIPVFDRNDIDRIAGFIKERIIGTEADDAGSVSDASDDGGSIFTHFDSEGNARMVDVSHKDITVRKAIAGARVLLNRETYELIKNGGIKKGDVLTVAQVAGIMGSKRTPDLIPMCHPVVTDATDLKLRLNDKDLSVDIEASVTCTGRTGVEMEAICACSVAAMTVYDMCKAVQRDIVITDIRLLSKSGGVHGDYTLNDPSIQKM